MKYLRIFLLYLSVACFLLYCCNDAQQAGELLPEKGYPNDRREVIFIGDSITAGFGLSPSQAFPAIINNFWQENSIQLKAINSGFNGSTSASSLLGFEYLLLDSTALIFIYIGGNDGQNKVPIENIRGNIQKMIDLAKSRGIKVVLGEESLPPSLVGNDMDYEDKFNRLWNEISSKNDVPLMPDVLRNIVGADSERYWQKDGGHPNSDGHLVLARDILNFLNKNWHLAF
jgi:acyl-CoA thioesterase-1